MIHPIEFDPLTGDPAVTAASVFLGLLNNELVGVYVIQDDRFRYVNSWLADLFGYTPEELCGGMGPLDLTAPEFRPLVTRKIERRIRSEVKNSRYSLDGLRKDGSRISIEVFGMRIDLDGRPAIVGLMIDNTDRSNAERKLKEQFFFITQLLDAIPSPVFYKDECGRYLGCNRAFEQFIGLPGKDVLGKSVYELAPKDLADRYYGADKALFDNPGVQTYEATVQSAEGGRRDVVFYKATFDKSDGSLGGLVGVILDITDRKRMETTLEAREQQWRTLVENSPNTIARYDRECRRIYVNPAFREMVAGGEAALVGRKPSEFPGGSGSVIYETRIKEVFETGRSVDFELTWKDGKGAEICSHIRLTAEFDAAGAVATVMGVGHDITELNAQREKIHQMAFYDPLTRLPNRRLLLDRLDHALASSVRSGCRGALLFIDLDNFKNLNDTLGHDVGDQLLEQVAKRLTCCVREGDTVARLGGDEFVVMLEDLNDDALEAAEQTEDFGARILEALNETYQLGIHECRSTPSVGATLFNGHEQSIDELLKQADIAMYQAKNAGRNNLRFFDPQMQETINARATLEGELRSALDAGQFELYYQVQLDSANRPVGAEALIRWHHPVRGLVAPGQFISVAEETDLILPIGHWVIETACAQLRAWQAEEPTRKLNLSVNLSAKQFFQSDFVAQIKAAVRRHGIDPGLLTLELTESLLLENTERIIATMKALKAIGVRFSLDDFGTGYSSLQYLKRLPLDQLKIDKSFVRDIVSDASDRAIVRTIIAMAQSLGLNVMAEGVETQEQRELLLAKGCTLFQGFLFSRPVQVGEFALLMESLGARICG